MSTANDQQVMEKVDLKPPVKYNIIIHNNDVTNYDEVIFILSKAFKMPQSEAYAIAKVVDSEGRAKCNRKPMTKQMADMMMVNIEYFKSTLAIMMPQRAHAVMMLKFNIKED